MPTVDKQEFCHNHFISTVVEEFFVLCSQIEQMVMEIYVDFDWNKHVIIDDPVPGTGAYWCDQNPLYSEVTFIDGWNGYEMCYQIGMICLAQEDGDSNSCSVQWNTFFMHYIQGCYPEPTNYNKCHDGFLWFMKQYYFNVYTDIEYYIKQYGITIWEYSNEWEFPDLPPADLYWCGDSEFRTAMVDFENSRTMYDICIEYSTIFIQQYDFEVEVVKDLIYEFWLQYKEYCPESYFYNMAGYCYKFYYDWHVNVIVPQLPDISIDLPDVPVLPEPHFEYCENSAYDYTFTLGGTLRQFCSDISDICVRSTDNNYLCQEKWFTFINQYETYCGADPSTHYNCHDIAVSLVEYEYFTISTLIQELFIKIQGYDITTTYIDSEGYYKFCASFDYGSEEFMHGVITWKDTCNIVTSICINDPHGSYHACQQVFVDFAMEFGQFCHPGSDPNRDASCHNYFIHLFQQYFFSIFLTMEAEIRAIGHPNLDVYPDPSYPVTMCDSNQFASHVGFTSCHSDLYHCQILAAKCYQNTGNDAETCTMHWQNYRYNVEYLMNQDLNDPYQAYYKY